MLFCSVVHSLSYLCCYKIFKEVWNICIMLNNGWGVCVCARVLVNFEQIEKIKRNRIEWMIEGEARIEGWMNGGVSLCEGRKNLEQICILLCGWWVLAGKAKKEHNGEFNHNGNMLIMENQFKDRLVRLPFVLFLKCVRLFSSPKPPYHHQLHSLNAILSAHSSR